VFTKNSKKIVLAIFLIAILIRLVGITMPILEGSATRQTQTAMISRNFFNDGFDILYPRVDSAGTDKGYHLLEFPIVTALAALIYGLLGGAHAWVGRLISIVFFAGAFLFLYDLTRRLFSERTAIWAVIVFSISPLSIIFSRTFMPDFAMLFFCIGSIYFMYLYSSAGSRSGFWLSCAFSAVALLAKPQSFYIVVPLIYLLWQKEKVRFFLSPRNWIYLIIALLPAILWYTHAGSVMRQLSAGEAYNFEFLHWFQPRLFLQKELYIDLLNIYSGIFLTPVGFALFIGALFLKTAKEKALIWAWFAGVILFMAVFNSHIDLEYYNLIMLPVASIFIARMIEFLATLDWRQKTFLKNRVAQVILCIILLAPILRYALYAYIVPRGYRYLPVAGERIQELSSKEDLIIASSAGGPQGLYFCDRKGWSFLLPVSDGKEAEEAIEELKAMRRQGARFFVATVMADLNASPAFKRYMFKNYRLIEDEPGEYIIFSLR